MNPPSTGLAARLISGTGALGLTMVGWSVLQIIAVPVFLLHWGSQLYADWLALNAAAGLLALLELGINAHLGARMMAAAGRDDTRAVDQTLSVALTLYGAALVLGGLLVMGTWLYGLDRLLSVTTPDAVPAGLILALSTLLLVARPILGSVLSAFGRFSLATYLGGLQQILGLGAQLCAVAVGGGLLSAALAHLGMVILAGWCLPVILIRRDHAAITFRPRWPGLEEVRHVLYRSGLHAVSGATTPLLLHLPVLFLQRLAPDGSALILFTTMRTYAGAVRQIVSQLVLSSAMEMTRQHHQGDSGGLALLFALTGRIAGGAAGLLAGLLLVAGGPIFQVWTQGALVFDPVLAMAFLAGALLVVPGLLGSTLLRLTDHADTLLRASFVQVGLCLILCPVLIPGLGALGAGLAVMVAELMSVGWLVLMRACRLFGLRVGLLVPAFAAGLGGLILGGVIAAGSFLLYRPDSLPALALAGSAWALLTFVPAVPILLPPVRRRLLLEMVRRSMRRRP
jgi:O-antigen/teichoic acid export membrane protein